MVETGSCLCLHTSNEEAKRCSYYSHNACGDRLPADQGGVTAKMENSDGALIAELMARMVQYSAENMHDIDHLARVWAYAKTIGHLEQLDEDTQRVLEAAAIVHDIACPLCREKYGHTAGPRQEREGAVLAADFLKDSSLTPAEVERVSFLVGHHHTFADVDGADWQILLEADYIANAEENSWPAENIQTFLNTFCRTASGERLLRSIFRF